MGAKGLKMTIAGGKGVRFVTLFCEANKENLIHVNNGGLQQAFYKGFAIDLTDIRENHIADFFSLA